MYFLKKQKSNTTPMNNRKTYRQKPIVDFIRVDSFDTLRLLDGNLSFFQPTPHSSFLTPTRTYTFSAKERDPETGLSYFGSRYYSSDLSVWLSVDPQAAKYPSLSPYVYCANNPVRVVDPDGETIDPASQDEWNRNKQQITSTIMNRLFQLVTNTEENSSYTNKSIMSLFNTLTVMDQMEQDPVWMFSLSSILLFIHIFLLITFLQSSI